MNAVPLDLPSLQSELARDPEFLLHSRYFTAQIRVVIGDLQSFTITVREGELIGLDPVVTPFDSYDVQLAGSEEQWAPLLALVPPPFYQDFLPAMLYHGFRLEGRMETIIAYYPALRRLGELLRSVANQAVTA